MTIKTLGWGVLGCGFIGKKQIQAIQDSKTGKVVAIASRSKDKLEPYAKETKLDTNNVNMYDSYEALLEDANVDIVYVPLPVTLKLQWIEKAAKAKKHVCFEKPLVSSDEVRKIIEIAEKYNVHVMDNTMWVHHDRSYEIQKKFLNDTMQAKDSDERILRIHAEFSVGLKYMGDPYENIRFHPELEPMGSLGDLGWYTIRGILFGFRYELPEKVSAVTVRDEKTNAIVQVSATLVYADGRMGTMVANFTEFYFRMNMDLHSKNSIITIPHFVIPMHEDNTIFMQQKKHKETTYKIFNREGQTSVVTLPPCDQTVNLIDQFVRDAQEGGETRNHWREETLKTMQVMEAIFASANQEGKSITLS